MSRQSPPPLVSQLRSTLEAFVDLAGVEPRPEHRAAAALDDQLGGSLALPVGEHLAHLDEARLGRERQPVAGSLRATELEHEAAVSLLRELVAADRGDRLHRADHPVREVSGVHLDVEQIRAARVARHAVLGVAADRREQVEVVGRVESPAPVQVHHARELGMVRVCVLDAGRDARGEEAQQIAQVLSAIRGRVGEARVAQRFARCLERGAQLRPRAPVRDARLGVGVRLAHAHLGTVG